MTLTGPIDLIDLPDCSDVCRDGPLSALIFDMEHAGSARGFATGDAVTASESSRAVLHKFVAQSHISHLIARKIITILDFSTNFVPN
ncbi:unnamed protein product [Angiostrongylus costaricensis]|uniref:Exonuclease domain-containing protein n=1 Tax=Angiostrongylus costaricensis TaxID=334426 RepID=A0A0R3PKT4_ANGCS|nr:unnamed protein product [Angiostrongylus costaricensis]